MVGRTNVDREKHRLERGRGQMPTIAEIALTLRADINEMKQGFDFKSLFIRLILIRPPSWKEVLFQLPSLCIFLSDFQTDSYAE